MCMQNALEEARSLLEQADKQRRTAEMELSDTNESLSEATVLNQSIFAAKRKMESEMATLHADFDEMSAEAKLCDDKAAKAMVDAARLADELRTEQDNAMMSEKQRKEMQNRLDEAETNALKGGKKAMNKMETRIRELESEMDAEGRRYADAQKNLRRSERRIKELTFAGDEDRKNHERMQGLIDSLQGKIKTYKKQLEEAEEIAALNLTKFRKVQTDLQESSNVAECNELALSKARARGRSVSVGPQ